MTWTAQSSGKLANCSAPMTTPLGCRYGGQDLRDLQIVCSRAIVWKHLRNLRFVQAPGKGQVQSSDLLELHLVDVFPKQLLLKVLITLQELWNFLNFLYRSATPFLEHEVSQQLQAHWYISSRCQVQQLFPVGRLRVPDLLPCYLQKNILEAPAPKVQCVSALCPYCRLGVANVWLMDVQPRQPRGTDHVLAIVPMVAKIWGFGSTVQSIVRNHHPIEPVNISWPPGDE